MKRQVFVIHGGDNFKSRAEYLRFLKNFKIDLNRYKPDHMSWRQGLQDELGKNFEVFLPQMPNKDNARYDEWEMWFKKIIPYMKPGVIFVGHSLGASFLAKFLSKNSIPKKIKAVFLISGPYKIQFPYAKDFDPPKNLRAFEERAGKIFIYHSQDDKIVPFSDFLKYKENIAKAVFREFKNRGHFIGAKIPELIRDIKKL